MWPPLLVKHVVIIGAAKRSNIWLNPLSAGCPLRSQHIMFFFSPPHLLSFVVVCHIRLSVCHLSVLSVCLENSTLFDETVGITTWKRYIGVFWVHLMMILSRPRQTCSDAVLISGWLMTPPSLRCVSWTCLPAKQAIPYWLCAHSIAMLNSIKSNLTRRHSRGWLVVTEKRGRWEKLINFVQILLTFWAKANGKEPARSTSAVIQQITKGQWRSKPAGTDAARKSIYYLTEVLMTLDSVSKDLKAGLWTHIRPISVKFSTLAKIWLLLLNSIELLDSLPAWTSSRLHISQRFSIFQCQFL